MNLFGLLTGGCRYESVCGKWFQNMGSVWVPFVNVVGCHGISMVQIYSERRFEVCFSVDLLSVKITVVVHKSHDGDLIGCVRGIYGKVIFLLFLPVSQDSGAWARAMPVLYSDGLMPNFFLNWQ